MELTLKTEIIENSNAKIDDFYRLEKQLKEKCSETLAQLKHVQEESNRFKNNFKAEKAQSESLKKELLSVQSEAGKLQSAITVFENQNLELNFLNNQVNFRIFFKLFKFFLEIRIGSQIKRISRGSKFIKGKYYSIRR